MEKDTDTFVCPKDGCDYESSKQGVKIHYGRSHDGSISGVLVDCEYCGKETRKDEYRLDRSENLFCSTNCWDAWKRENIEEEDAGGWQGGIGTKEYTCANCGKEQTARRDRVEDFKKNFCDRDCMAEHYADGYAPSGEDSPVWQGGNINYYGPNWPAQRQKCLERDNHQCRGCGMSVKQSLKTWGQELHVHHVEKFRSFKPFESSEDYREANDLSNLITYCKACHARWERIPIAPK